MAGYCGFSKSNNAVYAEQSGLLVASNLAREAARAYPRLRGVTAADIEAEVRPAEWHHTSKMYNKVNYYEFEALLENGVRGALYKRAMARRAAKSRQPITLTGCVVEWLEWSGTRRHPKAVEMRAADCAVAFKPNSDLVSITAPTIRVNMKKRLSTRGFVITDSSGKRVLANPIE